MSNRKSTMTGVASDATAHSQENFNAIYTAHQVHTIANLIFRQLTGGMNPATHAGTSGGMNAGWNAQTPWSSTMGAAPQQNFMNSGFGMMPGVNAMPMHQAPAGFAGTPGPLAPPALFYWYP